MCSSARCDSWMFMVMFDGTMTQMSESAFIDSSIIAQVAHRVDAHAARQFECLNAVLRVTAGRDSQQYVSLDAQGLDLPFEDILVAVIISYRGQDAGVGGEGDGPQGRAVDDQARNELGHQVLSVRGRSPIAADHQLVAGASGHPR